MATQLRRSLVAALVALLILLIAHWFDAGVLTDAQLRAAHPGLLFNFGPVAHLLTAAGVVALALTAWWSRSLLVGACYALVGGFLVLLPAMYWAFDSVTYISSNPGMDFPVPGYPLLAPQPIEPLAIVRQSIVPQPIASMLGDWYMTVSAGVTGAVFTLAAAMLVSGLVVIALVLRAHRRGATGASPATVQTPQ
jgi:hypothetical protein